jgi:sugar lactone lactonase YvrE
MNPYETIILDWSASKTQTELGSNVTYTIFAQIGGNAPLSNTTAPNVVTYDFGELESGGLYKFTIIATASGKSSVVNDVPAVFIRTMIHPVYDLSADAVDGTFGTVLAEWTPGTNYDESYQIVATPLIGVSSEFTVNAPETSLSCTDLLPNVLYRLVVTTFITGQSSEPETFVFARTNPVTPPLNLTITDFDISSATLSWDPPTSENLAYAIHADSYSGIIQDYSGITDTEFVCSNLTSGAQYFFSVYTVYKEVQSTNSIDITETLPVGPPTNLSFVEINSTSVELNWSASPAQRPGYQDVVYNISGNNLGNPEDFFNYTTGYNELTFLLDDIIDPGSLYDVYITTDLYGVQSAPALIQIFTGTSPPFNLDAAPTDGTTDSITVNWSASPSLGVSYNVYLDGVPQDAGTETTYVVTGLEPGVSYEIYVTALAGENESDPTATLTVTTYIDPPANRSGTVLSATALVFNWDGVDGSDYEIKLSNDGGLLTAITSGNTYEFNGLLSGDEYNASIRRILGDLCSYVVDFEQNPYFTDIAPVTNLTASPAGGAAGSSNLVLNWSLSPADNGEETAYEISVDNRTFYVEGGNSTVTVDGFEPQTSYTFDVTTIRTKPPPSRRSTVESVGGTTNAQIYPTMTFDTSVYGFAYAADTIGGGIVLPNSGLMFVTDVTGGDVWVGDRQPEASLIAVGVSTPFVNPRGITFNPLAETTPLLIAHADGVTAMSLDGSILTPLLPGEGGVSPPSGGWGLTPIDALGNMYITVPDSGLVCLIQPSGETEVYAQTTPGSSPEGIALADNGTLYVADSTSNCVWQIPPSRIPSVLTTISGSLLPSAILYSVDGNLYVADRGNRKIFKVTLAGTVTTFVTLQNGFTPLAMTQDPVTGNLYTTHTNGTVTEIQVTLT